MSAAAAFDEARSAVEAMAESENRVVVRCRPYGDVRAAATSSAPK